MNEYRTKSCHRFGQKEIIASIDPGAGLDPSWIINFFEKSVEDGKRYNPNETVQIGWMVLMLKNTMSGELDLWEPQFDSIPIRWTRGINNTIRHLVLQKSVAELLKVEPAFPSLRQSGAASAMFLSKDSQSEFRMKRESPSGNDSGWRFTATVFCQEMEYRSLFELSFFQMAIVPFLALPVGTTVFKSHEDILIEFAGNTVCAKQNPLLQKIVQSNILI